MKMPVYDYDGQEINIKVVYYGPGLSGKTTNLEYIYSKLPKDYKGKMVSMKTKADRTLFFDFLPINVGSINGMRVRFLLYTVPGQVYYNATRKLVLKGVDAIVFVADSQSSAIAKNKDSLKNLEENLNDLGMTLREIPWVVQFNKRDLDGAVDVDDMKKELGFDEIVTFEGVATEGKGVYETFEGIANIVFEKITRDLSRRNPVEEEVRKGEDKSKISVEVVAKGNMGSGSINSEAGKGESLNKTEEREEEHESVSEFVDNVLKENGKMEEFGSNGEEYEDYGHLVNLNDESEEPKEEGDESIKIENEMELISDPLEKLSTKQETAAATKTQSKVEETSERIKKDTIIRRIPVEISESELKGNVPVKVLLEIKVVS